MAPDGKKAEGKDDLGCLHFPSIWKGGRAELLAEEMPMPIRYHVQRASAERRIASEANTPGPAGIHVALAEMHEQAAAADVNQSLAPFQHPHAWNKFAR